MPLAGMGRDPTAKPEWGAMLDVSRLSVQGLANWFVLNEGGVAPRDVVGGAGGALTSGIGWSASEEGPCLVKNASTATTTDYFDTGLRVSSGSGTIVFRAYPAAAYNSASIEMLWGAYQASPSVEFSCQKYSDNNLYFGWTSGGVDGRVVVAASASNWAQNQWQTYALVWSSAGSVLYRNGVQIGSTATAAPAAALNANINLFNRNGAGIALASGTKIGQWAYFNRALTGGEVAALYAQPYDLFLPSSVRRFYGLAQVWQQWLTESLPLSDAARLLVSKVMGETLALGEARINRAGKALNESVSLADTLASMLNGGGQALSKLLMEGLAWSDARQAQASKRVAETLNVTDSRALGLARRIGETLGFADNAQATGAGLAVLTLVTAEAFGDGVGKGGHGDALTEFGGKG